MKLKKSLTHDQTRIILLLLGSVLSIVVLTFSVFTIIEANDHVYVNAPKYLLAIFIALAITRPISIIKDHSKLNILRCIILFTLDVLLGIVVLFANDEPYFFSLTAGLYCVTIVVSRAFKLIQKHDLRSIIINAIAITFAVLLAIGLFIPVDADKVDTIILVECILIAVTAFMEVISLAFSQLKLQVLGKVILKTFALEVLLGLLVLVVAASLILMMIGEPQITSFGDGLWYCFAVVTTIGFGDIAAQTLLGRIITVVLGIYGVVVVALITSIIVNFYNETVGKHDQKELKELTKEANDKLDEKEKKSKK